MSTATKEPRRVERPPGTAHPTSGVPSSGIPLPSTDLERASTSFTNFFLHIHPVKVNRNTLRPVYTLGLGLISLFLFLILVVTGILLMFYYVPSTTQAYDRMLDLRGTVAFGIFLRNMHRWSAHGMVAMVFLHMCRVFLTGAYKKPREFNWVIGVVLLLVTLFLSFTGYLLPWDQLAFWAITVGTSIAGYAPLIGKQIQVRAAGRYHRGAGSAAALLRAARGGAAGDADAAGRDPLLAHSQGWRPVAAGRQDLATSVTDAPGAAEARKSTACRASCADRSPRSATCRTIRSTAGRTC